MHREPPTTTGLIVMQISVLKWLSILVVFAALLLNGCTETSPSSPRREFKLVIFGVDKTKEPTNFFGPRSEEYLLPFELSGSCGSVQWIPRIGWISADDATRDPLTVNDTGLFVFSDIKSRGTLAERSEQVLDMRTLRAQEIAKQMLVALKFEPITTPISVPEPTKSSPLDLAMTLAKGRGIVVQKAEQSPVVDSAAAKSPEVGGHSPFRVEH